MKKNREELEQEEVESKDSRTEKLSKQDKEVIELSKEVEELKAEVERCDKLIDEYKAKANSYLNTASYYKEQAETNKKDFDRYKERNKNIETDAIKNANSSVAKKLLPIMDNFDHAMMAVSPEVMKGFVMIYSSLSQVLKDIGVSEIACKNEKLNPEKHNCIEAVSTDNAELDDVICKVYQKGYMFAESEEIIRPATVSVYKFN